MRKYTYTLKEERQYVVGIDAESEQEADKILDKMSKKEVEKHLTEIVWFDIISVKKGDYFEKLKRKRATKKKSKK
jgi:low affinity Fe/Cu permease